MHFFVSDTFLGFLNISINVPRMTRLFCKKERSRAR